MSLYSRSGRPRPGGSRVELAIWYLMRISGLALFVLAITHFLILHVLYDPADQTSAWIAEVRWSSTFWRVFDWSLLMMVLFHAFLGVRTVVNDHSPARIRGALVGGLSLVAALVFAIGTVVVLTMPVVPR
jgi:succinate dehydrogenase / fumarate reductase membrane anchor subunit